MGQNFGTQCKFLPVIATLALSAGHRLAASAAEDENNEQACPDGRVEAQEQAGSAQQ